MIFQIHDNKCIKSRLDIPIFPLLTEIVEPCSSIFIDFYFDSKPIKPTLTQKTYNNSMEIRGTYPNGRRPQL
jgi:hypothetical protein